MPVVSPIVSSLTEAIWQRYQADLLPLVDPLLNTDTDTDPQLDLLGPDDELPF